MTPTIDHYAQRAGEEFFSSNRALTPEARARHRRVAEYYASLLRRARRAARLSCMD